MAENGEEKLIAVARHIAKTLGHNDTMADDILQIFSKFDGRFSREKLSEKMGEDDHRTYLALEQSLKSLDRQIAPYIAADHPIWSDPADSSAFLDATDELIQTIRDWNPMAGEKPVAACLDRADFLLQQVMFKLAEEFRSMMERGGESFDQTRSFGNDESAGNLSLDSDDEEDEDGGIEDHIPMAHPIADYDIVIDALPFGTINDLHEIAKRMIAAGFDKECSHVFSSCRREFLEESLSRLGLQKLSIDEVQRMAWSDLEDQTERWIKAANVALRVLFPSERRLCDRIFFGFSSSADLSFMEVCRGSTIQLLNFADAVALGSRAPERLFKVLDVFETLRDLMPELDVVFSNHYCFSLRNEAVTIWKRLGESIRAIFMELENLIRRDPPKTPVPGGSLHPITRYVINYLRAACRSRQTLEQVFDENISPDRSLPSSSLSIQMVWIMDLLDSNLEAKSKIYKDSALRSVFMMNNGRYIINKVRDNELGSLLGDDWIRKHSAKIRQFHLNYHRSSWSKMLGLLKPDSTDTSKSIKEKLKLFNTHFEDTCRTQSTWVIFEDQMREELRSSVAEKLLLAYENFIKRFQNIAEAGKQTEKTMKYSLQDMKARIDGLFEGGRGGRGGSGRK